MPEELAGTPSTEPAGISGWLILPAIGTVIAPLWTLKTVVDLLAAIFGPDWVRTAPSIQKLIIGEVVVNTLSAAAWAFGAFLLFKQKKLFPAAFIAMCAFRRSVQVFGRCGKSRCQGFGSKKPSSSLDMRSISQKNSRISPSGVL